MKKLVSELSGAELDYWVGMAEEQDFYKPYSGQEIMLVRVGGELMIWNPTTNPEQAWPIIERDKISLKSRCLPIKNYGWYAEIEGNYAMTGETSLIAAMRCFVASVYGEYVDDQQSNNQ